MAKKISRSDISESDIFGGVKASAEGAITVIDELNDALKKSAETLSKDIKGVKFGSAKEIKEFTKAIKEANKLKEDTVKLDKERAKFIQEIEKIEQQEEKTKQQKIKTQQQELRLARQLKQEKEKENKTRQRAIKLENDENNAYKKLVKSTRDQKNESKRLAVELINLERAGKKNSKEWRKLNTEYKKVTKSAQQGDKALKKIDGTVGDNFRNVGNYRQALGKLTSVLGGLGLAFGGIQLLRSAGKTVADFGQSVADLTAITGASGKDLEFFKKQAIELGKDVEGGATAVVEAYKLIASAKPELLENAEALDAVTQSAITLSQASGLDLPDASIRLTDALNQFGAPAEQAGKFIDILANGAKFGSAEIPQITDALLKFGSVSKTTNVSIAESTALIEALAEKGLKGAEAGTALRNIMIKLSAPDALPKKAQDALNKLGISFEDLTDESKPFSERLKALKPLLDDNGALMDVFGLQNEVAAINLLESTDRVAELTEMMDKNGTATEQAEERTGTLAFALIQVKNAWDSWILSMSEGTGASEGFTWVLQKLAENFTTIMKVIIRIGFAWVTYKTAILGAKAVTFLFGGGLQDMYKQMVKSVRGFKLMGRGAKKMGRDVKSAGKAMYAVPWIAIIALVTELAIALYNASSASAELRRQQMLTDAYTQTSNEQAQKRITERTDTNAKEVAELERKRDVELASVKDTKKRMEIEAKFLKQKEKIISSTKKVIKADITLVNNQKARFKPFKEELDLINKKIKAEGKAHTQTEAMIDLQKRVAKELKLEGDASWVSWFTGEKDLVTFKKVQRTINAKIAGANEKLKLYHGELDNVSESQKDINTEITVQNIKITDNTDKVKGLTGATKKLNAEFSDQIKFMKELNDLKEDSLALDKDIAELETEKKVEEKEEKIEDAVKKAVNLARTKGVAEIGVAMDLIGEKEEMLIKGAERELDFSIKQAQKEHDLKFQLLQANLDKELKEKLTQKGLTPEQIQSIKDGYKREQNELDFLKIEAQKTLNKEITVLTKETEADIRGIKKETADEEIQLLTDVNEAQEEFEEKQRGADTKTNDKRLADLREWADKSRAIIKAVSDFWIKKSNEKIAGYDKEISKAEEQSKILQKLAENGNINAQQSLAEQNRLIAEANKKKLAEERKQQAVKQASVILETYLSKVEADEKNPLLATIQDIALLNAFIATIPSALEGTEDTGANGVGIDGKGGFHAILHPNERVLTKEQNRKVGNLSNEELASFANEYNTGQLINKSGAYQIGNGWNTGAIVERLESLENTIKNKPETNVQIEDIVQGAMTITRETRKGNSKVYNRYKIKG